MPRTVWVGISETYKISVSIRSKWRANSCQHRFPSMAHFYLGAQWPHQPAQYALLPGRRRGELEVLQVIQQGFVARSSQQTCQRATRSPVGMVQHEIQKNAGRAAMQGGEQCSFGEGATLWVAQGVH